MTLKLYNTLSKRKEEFRPLTPGEVTMYNCGPTVYSYAHIGNFASFVMADVLRRHLEYRGFKVRQIMNITDVGHLTDDDLADAQGEDKLEKAARERKKDIWEIAREFEDAFHEDRKQLNLREAERYPRATDHITEMIEMIQELMALGLAYQANDQVYFEIARFPSYGVLSGNTPEQLVAGSRVEEDPHKKSPLDFTLWKKDPKHLMKWESPWGEGFPGWHIECSAMARRYLGPRIDIHTGGEDNIFPHHECEIAQSSAGKDEVFARYWLHRRHIFVEGKKMSKSAGNFYTVRDLLGRGYDGLEIRYALVSSHYRSQSNFTFQGLDDARKNLRYLREFRLNMESLPECQPAAGELENLEALSRESDAAFVAALDDDLNTSGALGVVHEFCSAAYSSVRSRQAGGRAAAVLARWDSVLGVLDREAAARVGESGGSEEVVPGWSSERIEAAIEERRTARNAKDFAAADRIRDELAAAGIVIKDGAEGTRWHRSLD